MSDFLFIAAVTACGVLGAVVVIWLTERRIEAEVEEWESRLPQYQGEVPRVKTRMWFGADD